MLNWLMNKVRSGRSSQPVTYDRDQHPISRRDISKNALKVLYRLQSSGFDAYLVGGGVRDLLLDLKPKDFDIATDATPEQVRKLFRNSRIIGRRFKIVHVRFGPEIIEVTTFRGDHDQGDDKTSKRNDAGMLIRDNVYGDVEQDAIRRDFTINALYYTTEDFSVRDYVGGVRDLDEGVVRIIGDAETRYREDPVRMIRAIRFAAKLQFKIEKNKRDTRRSTRSRFSKNTKKTTAVTGDKYIVFTTCLTIILSTKNIGLTLIFLRTVE